MATRVEAVLADIEAEMVARGVEVTHYWGKRLAEARKTVNWVAWTEDDVEFVCARRPDLGERPVTRPVTRVKAARWLNEGTEEDVLKARAHAASQRLEGAKVFAYPLAVSDARGEAIAYRCGRGATSDASDMREYEWSGPLEYPRTP